MVAGSQLPGAASNFDYWLRRCEGFRVDSPQGRVGLVAEVWYASRCDRPDVIAVRAGLLGRLLLIVPVAEIAEILPREERIVLHGSPRATAPERLQDLGGRVHPGGVRKSRERRARGVAAGAERLEAQGEVIAVIKRLARRIGLSFGRGGEREMTPDVEPSAEQPSAEEPSAGAEEPAAEEAAAEAVPAEEPAAEEPPVEEQTAEEQPTA